MEATIWELSGKVKSSKYRMKVLTNLSGGIKTPTEIKDETKLSMPHTSRALAELNKWKLIQCKNPASKKGKLYCLTNLGEKVLEILTKKNKNE
ncbi:MarR family transcriptional regulator [Candidatus Woesearchaeota archaeon]|nr:MarR family transcriptional regulator [Candidatus Woesearchaeota archaeon]